MPAFERSTVSFALHTGQGKPTSFIGKLVSSIESGFWQFVQVTRIMAHSSIDNIESPSSPSGR